MELTIRQATRHWIAVDKPAGLQVEQNPWETSVEELLREQLTVEEGRIPTLGIVHRLDKVTSGILLLARRKSALRKLSRQFEERSVEKSYLAWVAGVPALPTDTLLHYHVRSDDRKRALVFAAAAPGRKEARLQYELLRSTSGASLIRIQLLTGRYHQIRAQLAAVGHPILGDSWYDGRNVRPQRIALHAGRLAFTDTAVSGNRIQLDWPWTDQALEAPSGMYT